MSSESRFSTRVTRELAYFSGLARLLERRTGGAGVILRFERVRLARGDRFQPHKFREITPAFLDQTLSALKRWKFDIVSMDEVCRRAVELRSPTRFVCLTFDGGYKDLVSSAYPVLQRHGVPFTVYVPTAFPDGLGEAWWLALAEIIAGNNRLALMMDRKEKHFQISDTAEKYQLYEFLDGWMRSLAPEDRSAAINDLCGRYSVDLAGVSHDAFMTWDDLSVLAADPNVTIGSATVNYPVLSSLKDAAASREVSMGKAVAQAAFRRDILHFAYPFGDRKSYNRQHVMMAADAGFASAVTSVPGVVEAEGRSNPHALPRIAWDGRQQSLRAMRVMLSGLTLPRAAK